VFAAVAIEFVAVVVVVFAAAFAVTVAAIDLLLVASPPALMGRLVVEDCRHLLQVNHFRLAVAQQPVDLS
jgi:hypothetical protein